MKKKNVIRICVEVTAVLLLLVWVAIPLTTGKLHLKIYFEKGGGECSLYYATADHPVIDGALVVTAPIEEGCVDLILDAGLAQSLSDIRLDLPTTGGEYLITRVELSSGGLVQKNYDASVFFSKAAIVSTNDITSMDPVAQKTYILTGEDPYIVFNTDRVAELRGAFSHYTMTKFCVAAFVVLAYLFARKKEK